MLISLVIVSEIALFIAVPVYLRARQRKKLRSHIHIWYDSRRDRQTRIFRLIEGGGVTRKQSIRSSPPMRMGAGAHAAPR
jgi:hypothetical protein